MKSKRTIKIETKGAVRISIKIEGEKGCFCLEHSKETNKLIDEIVNRAPFDFEYREHETGPEILTWLAFATSGIVLTNSLIGLILKIVDIIKKGPEKGDEPKGKLSIIIRIENDGNLIVEKEKLEDCLITFEILGNILKNVIDRAVDRWRQHLNSGNSSIKTSQST